ncbi:hypothetical protein [Yokenella regensburgei]|uniref:hypothetical protein n=1 Tax=Yokenella regensburgei TaxID=158877 RepID=UPI0031DB3BE9
MEFVISMFLHMSVSAPVIFICLAVVDFFFCRRIFVLKNIAATAACIAIAMVVALGSVGAGYFVSKVML